MGRININWVETTPTTVGESYGNACILASGNAPDICSNPQLITKSTYTSLITSTTHEYKALQSYFKNFSGTPTNDTYVYWMGEGEDATGMAYGSDLEYGIRYGPYDTLDKILVDPTGGSNWQVISGFNITTCPSGYTARTGAYGKYNGEIYFSGVIEATIDVGGPYFDSGGAIYSGVIAREIMEASGGRINMYATRNGFGVAAKALIPKDIQFLCPAYDTTTNTGIMGDETGSTSDLSNCLGICAGNRMMTVWALPKAGRVGEDMIGGEGVEYQNIRDYVGKDKNSIGIYGDVATGTDSSGNDDVAACLLGRICDLHPHRPLSLVEITVGLESRADEMEEAGWTAGGIICIIQNSELGFSADQLSCGSTFSASSPVNRINAVRCRNIVEFRVKAGLWKLLSSGKVRISKSGLGLIMDNLNAIFNGLESEDIIDAGPRIIDIPLARGTPEEWAQVKNTLKIPSIIARWTFNQSPEELNITQFGEIQ